jgi:glycerol-3-phosphate O-acyltransferase/dihydroxyacetone phosphate acyltransferase
MGSLRGVFVRVLARLATLGWFRTVEHTGLEHVPHDGPVLVVANHGGGFVDPALLAATLPRFPRFLAMATLWKTPARPFLWFAGAIPVYRSADGATRDNLHTFAACHDVLAEGGVIGIFPEGQASDEPHLLPVKTGAARIVIGARARGTQGLKILPVGLIYEDKARARAAAYVRVGSPLLLDRWIKETFAGRAPGGHVIDDGDHEVVHALTEQIRTRLAAVALNFDDAAQSAAMVRAAEVALRPLDSDPGWTPALDDREDLAGRLAAAPADEERSVVQAAAAYKKALEANAVTDRAVAADPSSHRRIHLFGDLLAVALIPLAVAGAVINVAPGLMTRAAGRPSMAPVTRATVKFLVAFVAFPVTWLVWRYTAIADEPHPWLLTAFLGPICGLAGSWLVRRVERGYRARLSLRELAGVQASLVSLRARRAALVEAVERAEDAQGPSEAARS